MASDYLHTQGDSVKVCNPTDDTALRHVDGAVGVVKGRYYNGRDNRYTVRIAGKGLDVARDYDLSESELSKYEP